MGEPEKQGCMQLTEELQFVTACLIGHFIRVQTKSFLLSGMLIAANFDKDYGLVLNVGGKEVHHGKIKIFLEDIAYISAENVSLDLDKDAMLESSTKTNHSKVVTSIAESSAGQSGENKKKTIEQDATSFASSTNTVLDQKLHHPPGENTNATLLNATSMASTTTTRVNEMASFISPPNNPSQPMIPIMQLAQTDNSFQGVQRNSQPIMIPVLYQSPNNYGVQWQYANAGGQFATYAPPLYMQAAHHVQGYVPHLDPQVQGYRPQPQFPPGSQNFIPSNQTPRGHQGPR